jgi:alanine dehydrogenase
MNLFWLSESDVRSLLTPAEAVPLVEAAFAALGRGDAQMPPKMYLDFKEHGGDLRAMPAYLPKTAGGRPYAGVKVVNSHPGNPAKGLPTVAAVFVLNDPATGMPLAILAAGALTDARTGAAGAVAAKYMVRPGSRTLGLVGCGRQAVAQLEAILSVLSIEAVRVAGKDMKEAEDFCGARKLPGVKLAPCGVQEACAADIVVTTTPGRAVAVRDGWIKPGTHINAIGADAPGKQEIESALLARARVVVDRKEQAFHSGEVNVPLSTGALKENQIVGELGEVVTGQLKGRLSDTDVTLFDSTGLAVQDVAVAAAVYEKALAAGRGQKLNF